MADVTGLGWLEEIERNEMADSASIRLDASDFSHSTSKAAAYAHIQKESQALEAKIQALSARNLEWKRRHNALSTISGLPSEILSAIFKCITGDKEKDTLRESWRRWIPVTRVCSHWRHVALECSSLWTDISFDDPVAALEILKRSKVAPLSLRVTLRHISSKTLPIIMGELYRVCELSLVLSTDESGGLQAATLLGEGAVVPSLKTLRVIAQHQVEVLPETFLGSSSPLHTVDLYNCNIHWNSPFLHGLTSLKLRSINPRTSLDALISALARTPDLETLSLEWVFPTSDTGVIASDKIIQLPRLSSLYFKENITNCTPFLASLAYPKNTAVKINISDIQPLVYAAALDGFHRLLSERLGSIRCLCITDFVIRAWAKPGLSSDLPEGLPLLHVDGPYYQESPYFAIWKDLRLEDLETLHVKDAVLLESDWVRFFGSLEHLKHIRVSGIVSGCTATFVSALSNGITSADAPATQSGGGLILPALRHLEIRGLDFGRVYCSLESCEETLHRIFLQRHKRGMALHELRILDKPHRTSQDAITRLEDVVKIVKWVH